MNEKTDASGAQVPCISLLEEASAILNRAYDVLMSDAKGAALIDALDPVAYDIERIKPRVAAALTILSSNEKFTPELASHIRTKYGADLIEIANERPEIMTA